MPLLRSSGAMPSRRNVTSEQCRQRRRAVPALGRARRHHMCLSFPTCVRFRLSPISTCVRFRFSSLPSGRSHCSAAPRRSQYPVTLSVRRRPAMFALGAFYILPENRALEYSPIAGRKSHVSIWHFRCGTVRLKRSSHASHLHSVISGAPRIALSCFITPAV
jgi:hypothetical protein